MVSLTLPSARVFRTNTNSHSGDATPYSQPRMIPLASEWLHFKGQNKPVSV